MSVVYSGHRCDILIVEVNEQPQRAMHVCVYTYFLQREVQLAKLHKIPEKVGAKVLGGDCCVPVVTGMHFVNGIEG